MHTLIIYTENVCHHFDKLYLYCIHFILYKDRLDRMVVGLTTTYATSAYHH